VTTNASRQHNFYVGAGVITALTCGGAVRRFLESPVSAVVIS